MRRPGTGLLLLALLLASCAPSVSTVSPSPTATPTLAPTTAAPTPSPSPLPTTPQPTPTRVTTPEPTVSYTAGTRLLPFYFQVRPMFPLFPPAPTILPDEPSGMTADADAVFRGLDAQGQPMFAVRSDFVMDLPTAAHEMGHAYQKLLEKKDPSTDFLALYWTFRGFPGTWQQAQAESLKQLSTSATWEWSPQESWAEAFRESVTLQSDEKTLNYGKPVTDPLAMRQFFLSLASK